MIKLYGSLKNETHPLIDGALNLSNYALLLSDLLN